VQIALFSNYYNIHVKKGIVMNENEEIDLVTSQPDSDSDVPADEFPADADGSSRPDDVSVSSGDSGETSESVSGGDATAPDVSAGDSVSGGSSVAYEYTVYATDYTDSISALTESVASLNATVFLILVFLLLSWTERKISVGVKKFTRERRK
jgi:hypothetical protein